MGHANLNNLSDLWINLLYAKGRLSIREAVETAGKRGETLHASEGEYDSDSGMVGQGIEEYCAFLICDGKSARSQWGWDGRWYGPFIEPVLEAREMKPNKARLISDIVGMLAAIEHEPNRNDLHLICSDAIRDAGFEAWADYVSELPQLREVFRMWSEEADEYHNGDDLWNVLDRIPWRFCKGKRMQYRDIPRLGNVTR